MAIFNRQLSRMNKIIKMRYSTVDKWKLAHLENRSLIRIRGDESTVFLQGLITNDINSLTEKESPSIYCMFLNTSGRVLFDSIICAGNEKHEYIIEVDRSLCPSVVKHLNMYKVRRKLKIEALKNAQVHCIYNQHMHPARNDDKQPPTRSSVIGSTFCDGGQHSSQLPSVSQSGALCFPDPRVDLLGYRYISLEAKSPETDLEMMSVGLEDYIEHRCKVGVPEGKEEIIPGKALPLEYNMDYLHGVSFHKGCYIGQELTARTHHTGVIRKRILPIQFSEMISSVQAEATVESESGKSVGKVRRVAGTHGIGLLRLKETFSGGQLTCQGVPVSTWKPDWWPKDKSEKAEDGSN